MTSLPPAFEERMKTILKEEAGAFFQALQTPPPVSIRLNPGKTDGFSVGGHSSSGRPNRLV